MEEKFCRYCGYALILKKENLDFFMFCKNCDSKFFDSSFLCVICLVKYNQNYLILRQKSVNDSFCLLSGFVNKLEKLEDCVKREVKEETNLEVYNIKYISSYSYEKKNSIMCGFVCEALTSQVSLNYEVDGYQFASFEEAKVLLKDTNIGIKLLVDYERMLGK